jgi:hypothetical protein
MTSVVSPISARVAATWSPKVGRTPRILVPLSLDALVVRGSSVPAADVRMRPPAAAGADARTLSPPPFQDLPGGRAPGVYLHWALPDALTHGVVDGGAPSFPPIPDRWLVLRVSPASDPSRRDVRGWVLVAGDATPSVVDLDRFVESGATGGGVKKPLTALGHGDPAWAAYYDNVENRLGFHDPLDGVTAGPLAYLVCGWHADEASDPLGGPETAVDAIRMDRMQALGWSAPGIDLPRAMASATAYRAAATAAGLSIDPPATAVLSLYHGSIVGLGWPTAGWLGMDSGLLGAEMGGPPPASAIRVVVASTIAEAVTALTTPDPLASRVVEAVAARAEAELDTADGRARIDAETHARAFASFPGGDAVETVWQPPASPQPVPPGRGPRPFPSPVSVGVDKLRASASAAPAPPPVAGVRFESVAAVKHAVAYDVATAQVGNATLLTSIGAVTPPPPPPPSPTEPGKFVQVTRPLPRFHAPCDPVLLLQGAGRSFRHGADGRFSVDGTLACRATGASVASASIRTGTSRFVVRGDALLTRGVDNGSVPAECDELLRELVLLDPGSSLAAARQPGAVGPPAAAPVAPAASATAAISRQFVVEQSAWWALREPRVDPAPIVANSGFEGTLPSPVAVTPPVRPWTPLHVDWEAEYLPSAKGASAWSLDEVDFDRTSDATGTPVAIRGRARLTAAPASLVGSAASEIRDTAQRVGTAVLLPADHRARFASDVAQTLASALGTADAATADETLGDVSARLEGSDLLAGSIEPLHTSLRGGVPGDGQTGAAPRPTPFVALRAGVLRFRRLRVVDGFGQYVDLAGTGTAPNATPSLTWAPSLAVPSHPDLGLLPPRFTSPARLMLRLVDAAGTPRDADDAISPVCGFLLPNHLEEAIELFDSSGTALGTLRQGDVRLAWEPTPGDAASAGLDPDKTIANPWLAGIARGLLDHAPGDVTSKRTEHALRALLRAIDSTLWSVDPFAKSGDEHLSLLVGHPVAVLRGRLWLDVKEPITLGDVASRAFPVRIGSLAHWQDGVFGYYVDDDYRVLHLPDGAAARFAREIGPGAGFLQRIDQVPTFAADFASDLAGGASVGRAPITHPMLDTGGIVWVRPGQVVRLTLLVEPHATIHATTGILPHKSIGLRRRWMAPGLARIAPTFRFGPLLVDPNAVRMPVARDLGGIWSWVSRTGPGSWASQPVTHTSGDAVLSADRAKGTEGWLRLVPDPPPGDEAS